MDRLQKKCFIASASVHLLLVLILVIGPAFQSSTDKAESMPVLDFVPFKTVDALVAPGGGRPDGSVPRPAPPEPKPPTPAPPPVVQPIQRPPEPEIAKPTPPAPLESSEPSLEPKKKKIEVSTKQVTRSHDRTAEAKARADAQAKEDAATRRHLADQIGKMADHISGEVAGGTTVELKVPGGGGVPYANFLQAVKSRYANAWVVPDGVTDDEATTVASVTIARDGTVISARITRHSSSPEVDRSVQATLDRVKYAAPLPDDAKEDQRTVTINFNVKAKKALG